MLINANVHKKQPVLPKAGHQACRPRPAFRPPTLLGTLAAVPLPILLQAAPVATIPRLAATPLAINLLAAQILTILRHLAVMAAAQAVMAQEVTLQDRVHTLVAPLAAIATRQAAIPQIVLRPILRPVATTLQAVPAATPVRRPTPTINQVILLAATIQAQVAMEEIRRRDRPLIPRLNPLLLAPLLTLLQALHTSHKISQVLLLRRPRPRPTR